MGDIVAQQGQLNWNPVKQNDAKWIDVRESGICGAHIAFTVVKMKQYRDVWVEPHTRNQANLGHEGLGCGGRGNLYVTFPA